MFDSTRALYSQARGDLEIQRFLGIILKTKLVSSVSNKGLFNFQRVVITFYFRHSKKPKARNTSPLPVYFYEWFCFLIHLCPVCNISYQNP